MPIKKSLSAIPLRAAIVAIALLLVLFFSVLYYFSRRYFSSPVLNLHDDKFVYLYIPSGSDFDDVLSLLNLDGWLADEEAFSTMAHLMHYDSSVKSGRYKLVESLSARALVSMLRSGMQEPVKVTFNNVRTLDRLAASVARYLEVDSAEIALVLSDSAVFSSLGFNRQTFPAMFLPDTYEMWWNMSPVSFAERMKSEYDAFWNPERRAKADSLGLSPVQVAVLASIIEEESNKIDEFPIIARLYLNRLELGMNLQACPTLKFAIGDFSIRRILAKDMDVESPYNTYKYPGLPPGPIRVPSKVAIDAVLSPADCDYLFMCARPDGSGRHNFARTSAQHARNASLYHQELNKKRIYR